MHVGVLQNFMSDLLSGCRKAGIQVPGSGLVPEPLIVWHNSSSSFPGDTMAAAFEAAKSFFKKDPDILFVILPERGARFPTAEPPPCTVAKEYCWDPEADRLADASRLPH